MSIIYNGQPIAGIYKEQIINEADTINAGVIKISTQQEIEQGENNTSAVTPFYLSQKQDKLVAGDNIVLDENLIECNIYPDKQTIIQNDDDTFTTIGQLTKSGTIKFDWEGTQAEYTHAMLNGMIQPEWYCYITDDEEIVDYGDVANQSLSNLKADGEAKLNNLVADRATINLDNLSEEGNNKFNAKADKASTLEGYGITDGLNKQQITNCITEIPQRIKYTLENGTLTIKAGSVITVPYGVEDKTSQFPIGSTFLNDNFKIYDTQFEDGKFFVWAEIQNDIVVIVPASTRTGALVDIAITNSTAFPAVTFTSGGTAPTAGRYYNTINNKYYDMSNIEGTLSFPILSCDFTVNTGFTSVNQVFNGFGYIGSTAWVDKGVKFLSANGRNTDGTLKNLELETPKIMIRTNPLGANLGWWRLDNTSFIDMVNTRQNYFEQEEEPVGATHTVWYKPSKNITRIVFGTAGQWVKFNGIYVASSSSDSTGRITSFNPKQPFRAVDYHDYINTPHIVERYQNGNSWYRIWSDGWCEQGSIVQGSDTEFAFTFLKPFKTLPTINVHVYGYYKQDLLQQTASYHFMVPRAVSLTGFKTWASGYGTCWEARGYIA